MSVEPYPWPDDTPEMAARRIARMYRALIRAIAKGQCDDPAGDLHRLDTQIQRWGIHWHNDSDHRPPLDPDEWMTAPDLAAAIHRTRKHIYNWARLGHIEQRCGPDGTPEYLVATVIQYHRQLLEKRRRARQHH